MTKEEAIIFLRACPCDCEHGKNPTDCKNDKCVFGQAIRMLTDTKKEEEQ